MKPANQTMHWVICGLALLFAISWLWPNPIVPWHDPVIAGCVIVLTSLYAYYQFIIAAPKVKPTETSTDFIFAEQITDPDAWVEETEYNRAAAVLEHPFVRWSDQLFTLRHYIIYLGAIGVALIIQHVFFIGTVIIALWMAGLLFIDRIARMIRNTTPTHEQKMSFIQSKRKP